MTERPFLESRPPWPWEGERARPLLLAAISIRLSVSRRTGLGADKADFKIEAQAPHTVCARQVTKLLELSFPIRKLGAVKPTWQHYWE